MSINNSFSKKKKPDIHQKKYQVQNIFQERKRLIEIIPYFKPLMNELSIIRNLKTISKKSDNVYHLTASVQYKYQNQKPKQSSSNNQKKPKPRLIIILTSIITLTHKK